MKKTVLSAVVALCAAAAIAAEAPSVAQRVAKARELTDKFAPSSVCVRYYFRMMPDGEPPAFRFGYKCPNCNKTHYNSASSFIEDEKPMVVAGYLVAPDRVMVQDMQLPSNAVEKVEVEFKEKVYAARPVRRYPAHGALELATAQPVAGARPIAFAKDGGEVQKFFFQCYEDGMLFSGMHLAEGVRVRHVAGLERDVVNYPANAIALNAKNEAVTLSFQGEMLADENAFMPIAQWQGEEPAALEARLNAIEKQAVSSLVAVYLHRDNERSRKSSSRGRIRFSSMDDEKLDLDTLGIALDHGELLVPLDMKSSQISEIDKLEAVMPDGKRIELEFVGGFDAYAFLMLRFPEGKIPAGVKPMRVDARRPIEQLYSRGLMLKVRNIETKVVPTSFGYTFDKIEEGHGGRVVLDVPGLGDGFTMAVSESGELLSVFAKRRGSERWSSRGNLSSSDFAKFLAERKFNPEYAIRKGKDRIRVAWLGVETQSLTQDLAREKKASSHLATAHCRGALVTRIHPGTPAEKAGLKVDDVLIYARREGKKERVNLEARSFGGGFEWSEFFERVGSISDFDIDEFGLSPWPDVEGNINGELTDRFGIGCAIVLGLVRNGEKLEVPLTLAQAPVHFRNARRAKCKDAGVVVCDMTFEVRGYFKFADDAPGVVVCKVQPGNPAAIAGLKPLELVTHVDDQPVKDAKDFAEKVKGKQEFSLSVRRLEATRVVRIRVRAEDKKKGQ